MGLAVTLYYITGFYLSYFHKSVGFARMWPIVPGTHRLPPPWHRVAPLSVSEPPGTWSLCQPSLPGSAPVGVGGGGGREQRSRVKGGHNALLGCF